MLDLNQTIDLSHYHQNTHRLYLVFETSHLGIRALEDLLEQILQCYVWKSLYIVFGQLLPHIRGIPSPRNQSRVPESVLSTVLFDPHANFFDIVAKLNTSLYVLMINVV